MFYVKSKIINLIIKNNRFIVLGILKACSSEDRASVSDSEGRWFESILAYSQYSKLKKIYSFPITLSINKHSWPSG